MGAFSLFGTPTSQAATAWCVPTVTPARFLANRPRFNPPDCVSLLGLPSPKTSLLSSPAAGHDGASSYLVLRDDRLAPEKGRFRNPLSPRAALLFASTGIGFTVTGVPLAEDTALIEAGLNLALGPNATAGVSYSGQFGDGVQDNAVKGRLTWLF